LPSQENKIDFVERVERVEILEAQIKELEEKLAVSL